MEFISVTLMLAVLTSLVLTAAPAKKDTPEMDDIVMTSMNVVMEQIDATGTHVALTRRAPTPVAVIQVSLVMVGHVMI